MLLMATYTIKPFLSKDEQRELLDLFGKVGTGPGVIAHYMYADGSGGFSIGEADSLGGNYATVLAYEEFIEFEITPILTIDEALPHLLESVK
jgi:hypothetical protein